MEEGDFEGRFLTERREDGTFSFKRKRDVETLASLLSDSQNLLLYGHMAIDLFHQMISDGSIDSSNYVYIPSIGSASVSDFVFSLCRSLYIYLHRFGEQKVNSFCRCLVSVNSRLDFSEQIPRFSLQPKDFDNPSSTLEEISSFLLRQSLDIVFCIEDFDSYLELEQDQFEIVKSFVSVSGYQYVVLSKGLDSLDLPSFKPFSCCRMSEDEFMDFMSEILEDADRKMTSDSLYSIYALFDGDVENIFLLLSQLFSMKAIRKSYPMELVASAIGSIISIRSHAYNCLLSSLSDNASLLVRMLAKEGKTRSISSERLVMEYNLPSAQTVFSISRRLRHMGVIAYEDKSYSLADKFLALYVRMSYGTEDILSILTGCREKEESLRTSLDVDEIVRLLSSFKRTGLPLESIAMHLFNESRGFFDDGPTLRSVKMRLGLLVSEPLCPFYVDDEGICFLKTKTKGTDSSDIQQTVEIKTADPVLPGLFDNL